MSKTNYNIELKGYVGGWDFSRSTVDRELAKCQGQTVNVLIDSLGGSLATGLSISAAFKNHGDVHAHFVGLNASAATIASRCRAHQHRRRSNVSRSQVFDRIVLCVAERLRR